MGKVLPRLIVILVAGTSFALGVTLRCAKDRDYYYNSANCTFRGVIVEDPSNDISFDTQSYRYSDSYYVDFIDSDLVEIPRKLFSVFTYLQQLNMKECGIGSISRYTFESAHQLILLNISYNNIQELKNYVFTGASALVLLDLSNNNISEIEEKAFSGLDSLKTLLLTGNTLKTLPDNVFAPLNNMQKLSLTRNNLENLPNQLFESNHQLSMIFLQHNQLTKLDKEVFNDVSELEYLWLKNNSLTNFEFPDLNVKRVNLNDNRLEKISLSPYVVHLFASNNTISEIEVSDKFQPRLQKLDLSWNKMSSMAAIDQLSSLEVLDLSHNTIGPLKLTSFASLRSLVDLNLEDTKISNLQHGTFSQLSLLKRLDISYNNLNRIDVDIFTSSHLMEEIFIEGNRLKEVNYEELKSILPSLTRISIADNNWNCTFLTKMIRKLNTLSIEVGGFKSEKLIADKTNVKGIYCADDKNTVAGWNETAKHLDKYLNDSVPIVDTSEIKQIMQTAIEDIAKFNELKNALQNKSENLEGDIFDLTKKLIALENELYEVKQSILDIKLAQLANATNETYVSSDLKRMMQEMNDLTLAKIKQSGESLEFKIYQQSFKIDKFIEKINENSGKLQVLSKQMSQNEGTSLKGLNPMYEGLRAAPTNSSESNTSQIMMILIFVVLVGLLTIVLIVVYRAKLFGFGARRGTHFGTSNTLSTMMDNDI
ncbi:leucine-rich repeat-containing G-protein coupled receptor 4-like [Toxorhynchites rutilus septentrionalis]|uniref:leucine-rich repeat-containing G-protein coupled receptor 4-like n=1 Tax=Toxorhynchites rutilus septentrionalis TaxID=329112 RepID=UPI00247AE24A|nr:leucine-rich repeat-containing G-protein coupled receptor 4-like [Toxorhynchites rutilus septentrionalis]